MHKNTLTGQNCGATSAQKIYDYCYDYGYNWIYADDECGAEYEDKMLISNFDSAPDDFYDEFGEDAEWNMKAMYAGMARALKEITGKKYAIYCDGYRTVAVVGKKADAKAYASEKEKSINWTAISEFFNLGMLMR